jgi:hypothetical protein
MMPQEEPVLQQPTQKSALHTHAWAGHPYLLFGLVFARNGKPTTYLRSLTHGKISLFLGRPPSATRVQTELARCLCEAVQARDWPTLPAERLAFIAE